MMFGAVEQLLREKIGLDSGTVGLSVIRHALRERMSACQISELQDYWQLLAGSPSELQELINAVVVPETWFFRDREAFTAMTRHARARMRPGQPIMLLSLPCSTGEEPYSMAMAMFDAGFGAQDFKIDAVDVSTGNLAAAERAVYGRNSFRGDFLEFRGRYLEAAEGGLRPEVRVLKQVRFRLGNLFDPAASYGPAPYDIIFCRNLLIYFNRNLQDRALVCLKTLLAPDGLLLVGPAESGLPILHGFASARLPMAFAFTNVEPAKAPRMVAPSKSRFGPATPAPISDVSKVLSPIRPASSNAAKVERSVHPSERAAQSLASVERTANAGRVAEAKELARTHLGEYGPSAEIFYLLGLAQDAEDARSEAIQNYRKALYLEPRHQEALAHLALLLRKQGDIAGAEALTGRLGRIGKRSGT
ncbi:CheR family methyltransferase [Mesorhizobium sp. M0323]|uniref:CheR family methyltransferase n=1 Tax=Mesorhizobium sp. M0323 TaxID=2956938 RepID=UPI00333DCE93